MAFSGLFRPFKAKPYILEQKLFYSIVLRIKFSIEMTYHLLQEVIYGHFVAFLGL